MRCSKSACSICFPVQLDNIGVTKAFEFVTAHRQPGPFIYMRSNGDTIDSAWEIKVSLPVDFVPKKNKRPRRSRISKVIKDTDTSICAFPARNDRTVSFSHSATERITLDSPLSGADSKHPPYSETATPTNSFAIKLFPLSLSTSFSSLGFRQKSSHAATATIAGRTNVSPTW